ncbi:hypothetical+protein [Methylocapsa aurea]|jgi:hypothetical protein|uniref:hypothetical protein n=1 Tax=Methylocapsa aurea TaxID=663610 RepID=UPI003D1883E8
MTRKPYILVFSVGSAPADADVRPVANVLNEGDMVYAFDENVTFVSTALDIAALTERLRSGPIGDEQFFLADLSGSDRAGYMAPKFWSFLRSTETLTSAA